jgi:RHS repeat-associated protein
VLREGVVRYTSGTTPTSYTYTGQYSDSYINLLDYGSRRYDPEIGRFIQPDSIVPTSTQGVQAWDRYAYANNSPVVNTDPSGHCIWDGCLVEIIALAGLTIAASPIPSDVPQGNPADWGNPDVMVTELAITAGAPDIAALAGEGLMGLGKLISNPKLFAAGKASYDAATGAEAAAAAEESDPWHIGDPINKPTVNGYPSWSAARTRYWKNLAAGAEEGQYTAENLARMQRGLPPLEAETGVPMELHHLDGQAIPDPHKLDNLVRVWPWEHEAIDPFRHYNGLRPR